MEEQHQSDSDVSFRKMLEKSIAEANQNVTHADFVAGVRGRTMGFKCMMCEPQHLIRGARRKIFAVLVLLYLIAPAVLISLWALHERDWWLLIGIAASAIGTRVAARLIFDPRRRNSIAAYLFIAFCASWFFAGFHSYYAFFTMCALWGLTAFMIADEAEKTYALQSLVESTDCFDQAIAQKKIMIVRKDEERA
jgi:hypothetical protein